MMNEMTEEDYELELLGVNQEDEINSDNEREEIEEALYQSMHYAETIVDSNAIQERKNQESPSQQRSLNIAQPEKVVEGVASIDTPDPDSQLKDDDKDEDSKNSKYVISKKALNNLVNNTHERSSESEVDVPSPIFYKKDNFTKRNTMSCNVNESHILEDSKNLTNKGKPFRNSVSDVDDDCCLPIESASEDENLHVHLASKKPEASSSPQTVSGKVARYFDEPSSKPMSGKCFNCKQPGHYKSDCPEDKRPVSCILCGLLGHYYKQCPNQLCFNCDLPGHENKSCTRKRIHWNTVCNRCFMPGHEVITCADRWRQFHLTTKSKPKLLYGSEENMKQTYCYNCGKEGHLGYECRADRMERYVKINYPFVCNYSYKKFTYMAFEQPNKESENKLDSPVHIKRKKKKKEKVNTVDNEPGVDIQITVSKSGQNRRVKCSNEDNVDRRENKKDENNLQITFSKLGKKRKINCKNNKEINRAENSKESEKKVKKNKNKSKKIKKIETQVHPEATPDIGTKKLVSNAAGVNFGINNKIKRNPSKINTKTRYEAKENEMDVRTETKMANNISINIKSRTSQSNIEQQSSDSKIDGRNQFHKGTSTAVTMETSTNTTSNNINIKTTDSKMDGTEKWSSSKKEGTPSSHVVTDDDVVLIKTVAKRKRMPNEEEFIVLSSDPDVCNDPPDIITISDSSEDGRSESKKRKVDECQPDVIVLSDGDTCADKRIEVNNAYNYEINNADNDSRTPFAHVWGFPNTVVNTIKPLSKKIKKLFRKNMKQHNLPQEEKKKKNKSKSRKAKKNASTVYSDTLEFVSKRQFRNKSRLQKIRQKRRNQGKKTAVEMPTQHRKSLNVELHNESYGSSRFISMNGNTSKFKWYKNKK